MFAQNTFLVFQRLLQQIPIAIILMAACVQETAKSKTVYKTGATGATGAGGQGASRNLKKCMHYEEHEHQNEIVLPGKRWLSSALGGCNSRCNASARMGHIAGIGGHA